MAMKAITKDQLPDKGKLILIYGETNVGKTTSVFQSAPEPILHLSCEMRNQKGNIEAVEKPNKNVKANPRPNVDIRIAYYTNWDEMLEFLNEDQNVKESQTIFVDSFTFLMGVNLLDEIADQAFEARADGEKKKIIKSLVGRTKVSEEGYGGLSNNMSRLMKVLGRLSTEGKTIICSALLDEHPKWDRALSAAPALAGKDFPKKMPGFFDLIGLVQPRIDKEGNVIYPPIVSFESHDDSFKAKFTGKSDRKRGPLDFSKIL